MLVLVVCSLGSNLLAQDSTRIIRPSTRYLTENDFNRNKNWLNVDTNMNKIEIFQAPFKKYILFQDLGNAGSQSSPLLFDIQKNTGFDYSQNPFAVYFLNPKETQYINTKTPYSDLFYTQGTNNLIFLKVKHAQNILPRWNVGIDYQRLTSTGFLPRQYTSHYNFQAFTSFQSKSKQYTLLASVTWNFGLVEESGGIKSDSLFEQLRGNTKVVGPKLNEAETRFRNKSAYIKQYWSLGTKNYQYKDDDTLYDFKTKSHFSYTLHGEQLTYTFNNLANTDSTILPNQYYDIGTTSRDSTYYGTLENKLGYHWYNTKEKQLSDSIRTYFEATISHSLITVSQIAFIRNYHNILANLTYEKIALKNYTLSYATNASYNFSGFNNGDFKMGGNLRYRLPLFDISAIGLLQQYRPDYAFLVFKSNAFIWENNFDKIGIVKLGIGLNTRSWRHNLSLQVNNFVLQNWTYAGLLMLPEQNNNAINVQTFTISKTIQLWKFFMEHELMFQKSYSSSIRLPEAGGMIRYYFASKIFKTLSFQLGVSVFYNTAYYGNSYNPASRFFYLQNTTKIGNYPVIDPFFIGEIKRASFFAKYEHVNQDWSNGGFYYTPHYPLSLRSLRFGVRWRFYN